MYSDWDSQLFYCGNPILPFNLTSNSFQHSLPLKTDNSQVGGKTLILCGGRDSKRPGYGKENIIRVITAYPHLSPPTAASGLSQVESTTMYKRPPHERYTGQ